MNCHRRRTALRARRSGAETPTRTGSANRPLRRRNRDFVKGYLLSHPCADCGEADHTVLEFDHVGLKRSHVADLVWGERSLASITHEIDECEVRCANCHRRKTRRTLGHFDRMHAPP